MLTVLTPAASTTLTTVESARQFLALGAGTSNDVVLASLIRQASQVIADHCRRPFGLETVRESFICNQISGHGPLLARAPVVEILAARDGNGPIDLAGLAVDATTGRLRRLDARGFPVAWSCHWGNALSLDYRAGYVLWGDDGDSNLPPAVERACLLLVSTYFAMRGRDPGLKSETIEGIGAASYYVAGSADRLASPEAEQLLAPFVRYDA